MTPADHWIVGDAHAHLHPGYRRQNFLDWAARNLAWGAAESSVSGGAARRCLVLTETAHEHAFDDLVERATASPEGSPVSADCNWTVRATGEDISVRVQRGDDTLWLIAGAQIAAAEDLEVLLVGTRDRLPDGLPIREILGRARDLGVPRIVPWGVGKWLFGRGRLLMELVEEYADPGLFLGDEAGRPGFWPLPAHFERAGVRGVRNLPGSDPLPFPYDVDKVGRMGFAVPGAWDPARPAASLLAALGDPGADLRTFGRLEPLSRFVRSQIGMQLRKRLPGRR